MLVVVVLLSFIVLALMAVFNSTQAAFRASMTQTDVLQGGRNVMDMIKNDLETMTPSYGQSNFTVNFAVTNNSWQYGSNAAPLVQPLVGTGYPRTNVVENFFILGRQNQTWTGVGYLVDTGSTNYLNPLYRLIIRTNVGAGNLAMLYTNFLTTPITNWSHLVDGVVHLTVRAYDLNGYAMTNTVEIYNSQFVTNRNVNFSVPTLGEVGFYMFSNTLPASVQVELGVLEDRTIQRAESLPDVAPAWARSNYLAQQSGKVHLFRQRIPIRNVDPSAYQ